MGLAALPLLFELLFLLHVSLLQLLRLLLVFLFHLLPLSLVGVTLVHALVFLILPALQILAFLFLSGLQLLLVLLVSRLHLGVTGIGTVTLHLLKLVGMNSSPTFRSGTSLSADAGSGRAGRGRSIGWSCGSGLYGSSATELRRTSRGSDGRATMIVRLE